MQLLIAEGFNHTHKRENGSLCLKNEPRLLQRSIESVCSSPPEGPNISEVIR